MSKFTKLFNLQGFDVMPSIEDLERFITKYFHTHRIILYEATEVIGYDMQNFKKIGERRLLLPYAHKYYQSDIFLDPIGTPVKDFPQENIWNFNETGFSYSRIMLLPDGTEVETGNYTPLRFRRFYADYYSTFEKKVGYLDISGNGWYSINDKDKAVAEQKFYELCIAHWLSGFKIACVVIKKGRYDYSRGMVGGPNPTFLLTSQPTTNPDGVVIGERKALLALGADGFNGVPSVKYFSREAEIADIFSVDESYFSRYRETSYRASGYFHTYLKNVKRIPVIDEQEFIRGLYIGINIKHTDNRYNKHSYYGMSGINRSFYEGLVIGMAIKNFM